MEWFGSVSSIEELKGEYLNYLKKWKNDKDLMAEVNSQYEELLERFGAEANEKNLELPAEERKSVYDASKDCFAETLNKIIGFNMNIEIIGQWIWCFDSYEYREQLKDLGFWYSASKKAWVFSGSAKKRIRSRNKIDDVRKKWGVETVKEKEKEAV